MTKQVNEISLERAKTLLGQIELNEEKLKEVLERIKAFCKVSYQLYSQNAAVEPKDTKIIKLEVEPTNQFTTAA